MPSQTCIKDLFDCLDKAGIRSSSMTLTDAEKAAITTCAETAHTCFMTDMADRRHNGGPGGGPGDHHEAGAGAPQGPGGGHHDGAAGSRPSGWAGEPAHHEAGAPAHPAAGGSDAPRHHDEAGTDARGPRAGAPAPRGDGRGPGHHEGGAGGGN
jgi:hypothetical protein